MGVEYILNKIKKLRGNENITTKESSMCEYLCTGFIDFVLKGKSLSIYTILFCANEYEINDKIILKYFQ